MGKKRRSLEAEGLSGGGLTHNPFAAALGGRRATPGDAAPEPDADETSSTRAQAGTPRPALLLRREVKGTGGHPVCRVLGLDSGQDADELAREASRALGCRVQATEDGLVVGLRDPERVEAFLVRRGFKVKRAN